MFHIFYELILDEVSYQNMLISIVMSCEYLESKIEPYPPYETQLYRF